MKIGIVGVGAVGSACALASLQMGVADQIVLIDLNDKRARAIATDMRYGIPVLASAEIRDGAYADLDGADLVMITAGLNEKGGGATNRDDSEGRLRLLDTNVGVYHDIVPKVVAAAPAAVLMVVTDPPDPLADLTRHLAQHNRVLSTGTFLDSLRFSTHLAERLEVNPKSVAALAIGEHGTSEVLVWSSVRVGGLSFQDACTQAGKSVGEVRQQIERDVRFANITIIEGNNASQYGIGIVCARIAHAVLHDERVVLPVAGFQEKYGVTLSLPSVVGHGGVIRSFIPSMTDEEADELHRSAQRLAKAQTRLGLRGQNA